MISKSVKEDHYRIYGTDAQYRKHLLLSLELRYLRHIRRRQQVMQGKGSVLSRRVCAIRDLRYSRKYGLSIFSNKIGRGLYLGHAHNIDVHPDAVIGDNCNLNKGVTVGAAFRGERAGAPVIGNRVWIGNGAVVVGKITIGDDVLIAPNAYVNVDVPDHSIVIGNPCVIKHKEGATRGYVERVVTVADVYSGTT